MVNYFDYENDSVNKFWKDREEADRKMTKYLFGIIGLYILLFALSFFDKLSNSMLLLGLVFGNAFSIWLTHSESQNLHNKITLLQNHYNKYIEKIQTEEFSKKVKKL